jgi:hypothetical protein
VFFYTRQKTSFVKCCFFTLGKELLCRVFFLTICKDNLKIVFWSSELIQMKKFSTTNLYNSSRYTDYILVISSYVKIKVDLFIKTISLVVYETLYWQHFGLKSSCHAKLCLNLKFWNFQTTSDGKTSKIKVVGLEMLWNFIIDIFYMELSCHRKICLKFSNFKFKFCKRPRMKKLSIWKL